MAPPPISLKFLGTSTSPVVTRNYSSLLVRIAHQAVMVDCGEGTQRQLLSPAVRAETRTSNIRTVLITHLHPDHVLGLVPMLFSMMGPSAAVPPDETRIEIFGPLGLRALVRSTLTVCYAALQGKFVVHELLWPSQPAYPHEPPTHTAFLAFDETDTTLPHGRRILPLLPPHENEIPGRDIRMDAHSFTWRDITTVGGGVSVSAAPVTHRAPTVGYVFTEAPSTSRSVSADELAALDRNAAALGAQGVRQPRSLLGQLRRAREPLHLPDGTVLHPPPLDRPGRKLVVLGDTSDATAGLHTGGMLELARDADVLVHECTYAPLLSDDATLASFLLPADKAEERALERGHSVPAIAGDFAARIGAHRLVVNHFSARVGAPHTHSTDPVTSAAQIVQDERYVESLRFLAVTNEYARQVTEAWHARRRALGMPPCAASAVAAFDGLALHIPPRDSHV